MWIDSWETWEMGIAMGVLILWVWIYGREVRRDQTHKEFKWHDYLAQVEQDTGVKLWYRHRYSRRAFFKDAKGYGEGDISGWLERGGDIPGETSGVILSIEARPRGKRYRDEDLRQKFIACMWEPSARGEPSPYDEPRAWAQWHEASFAKEMEELRA